MQMAEPIVNGWKARLALGFSAVGAKTVLSGKSHDGPLVVQKPLYPEGESVCHAIVVHPPGGIAGGDELVLEVKTKKNTAALLTTPGAAKWYRTSGPWARQRISLAAEGSLEWLPQETIVYDGALADAACKVDLSADARFAGWDIVCLGRTGSGERFTRGSYRFATEVRREGRLLWLERGRIDGGSRLLVSPAGMGESPVFGTFFACALNLNQDLVMQTRKAGPETGRGSVTLLPGILLARYLGNSTEEARRYFTALWRLLRPALAGIEANEPRIWST